jgi:hypothetical protein
VPPPVATRCKVLPRWPRLTSSPVLRSRTKRWRVLVCPCYRHSGQTLGIFRSCIFSNHSGGGGDRPGLSMVGVGYGRKCVTLARCRPAAGLPSIPSCGLPVTLASGNFPSCIEEFGGNRVGKSRRDHSTPYADRVCVPSEPPLNCDYPMQNGCRTKLA